MGDQSLDELATIFEAPASGFIFRRSNASQWGQRALITCGAELNMKARTGYKNEFDIDEKVAISNYKLC